MRDALLAPSAPRFARFCTVSSSHGGVYKCSRLQSPHTHWSAPLRKGDARERDETFEIARHAQRATPYTATYADDIGGDGYGGVHGMHGMHGTGHTQASTLFVEGHRLALEPYILKAPCASFSVAMLDCYDLVVAMDETLVQQLLEEVDHDEYYAGKVISLAHFAPYCDRAALTAHGGTALLAVRPSLPCFPSSARPR